MGTDNGGHGLFIGCSHPLHGDLLFERELSSFVLGQVISLSLELGYDSRMSSCNGAPADPQLEAPLGSNVFLRVSSRFAARVPMRALSVRRTASRAYSSGERFDSDL